MNTHLTWDFPLPRTHTGIYLANGLQGVMVWGVETLNITVARAGFWDHRGGTPLHKDVTFENVKRLLNANDEANLVALFTSPNPENLPDKPLQYGGGRLELTLPRGLRPYKADLNLQEARLSIVLRNEAGETATVSISQAIPEEILWIDFDEQPEIRLRPTWEWIGTELSKWGIQPPTSWSEKGRGGFVQHLPADEPMSVAWNQHGTSIAVTTALGPDAEKSAKSLAQTHDRPSLKAKTDKWWSKYWSDIPRVELPDADIQRLYDYGVWRQAGMTPPHAPAAGLQGPWMEEFQIPPWSNDYHFNINVQMIYTPCLATNRADHFRPIWKMLQDWLPKMRATAKQFFGREDAILLPHAVDNQGNVVGLFWAGTIDHGCAAWMAQLAWQHYRFTLEKDILTDVAWPLLTGAFNGFWAMLEETTDGKLSLPITVSPEYNSSQMDAWGRDASFQLAACHRLAQILPEAAALLGQKIDPHWAEVRERLPHYTLVPTYYPPNQEMIGLWKGQPLAVSHRHHSHLAGIYPFVSYSPQAPEHRHTVALSLMHWNGMGAGGWTGWCTTWASALCARCDLPDAAVTWLHWFNDVFTNVGGGPLHNSDFSGAAGFSNGALDGDDWSRSGTDLEIMQMDGALGSVTAILELLVSYREGVIHVLPGRPRRWRDLAFAGIRTEGAFLIQAELKEAALTGVRVTSLAGEKLMLAHGLGECCLVDGVAYEGARWEGSTSPGQVIAFKPIK